MATRYNFDPENPIATLNTIKCLKSSLDQVFGGDMKSYGDLLVTLKEKVKYYIVKDETGYKIVDSEAED